LHHRLLRATHRRASLWRHTATVLVHDAEYLLLCDFAGLRRSRNGALTVDSIGLLGWDELNTSAAFGLDASQVLSVATNDQTDKGRLD